MVERAVWDITNESGEVTFRALHTHPLVAAGSVRTPVWTPVQDVPMVKVNADVPLACVMVGDVQNPEATVGAVFEMANVVY